MTETKLPEAAATPLPQDHRDIENLLRALNAMEEYADTVSEKLAPFDKPLAMLPGKELAQLRESLKRITARVGVSTALAARIAAEPEKAPDPPASGEAEASDGNKVTATPEDTMFPSAAVSDEITGLPSRMIGEKAIESALSVGRPRYAATFILDRVCHMAGRYGVDVGNQAIRHCAGFLNQKMPSDALLFRWRGAAFVLVFDLSGTMIDARLLMEQIAIQKVKFSFMTNHRSAMVNLTVTFQTISLAEHSGSQTVIGQIDQFIETHSARQPH